MNKRFSISPEMLGEKMKEVGFKDVEVGELKDKTVPENHPGGYTTMGYVEGYVEGKELPEGSDELKEEIRKDFVHPKDLEVGDVTWDQARTVKNTDRTKIGLYFEMSMKV